MSHLDLNKLLRGKKSINVTTDKEARAVYFKVSGNDVLKTVRPNESLAIDYDKDNEVVGIEIIRL